MQITVKDIDKNKASRIIRWLLTNSYSNTSSIKGKTPQDVGYEEDNYQKIELGFEEKYGSDTITVFFQKRSEAKGRSFYVEKLDYALYDMLFGFYVFTRSNRKSIHSIDDILMYDDDEQEYEIEEWMINDNRE